MPAVAVTPREPPSLELDLAIVSPQRQGVLEAGVSRHAGSAAGAYEEYRRSFQDTESQCVYIHICTCMYVHVCVRVQVEVQLHNTAVHASVECDEDATM